MIRSLCFVFAFALASLGSISLAQTFQDNFVTATPGSDGSPDWEPQSVGWEIREGALFGDEGSSVWQSVPFASAMTFACDVTVLEQLKGDWLIAGIGIQADEQNYWATNLVVSPEARQRQHSAELNESLNAHWLAAGDKNTRLPSLPGKGGFDWQFNQTYRMEISLSSDKITARITKGSEEMARYAYELPASTPAVRSGRPFLRVNGLRVRFSNARATVTQTAPKPETALVQFPPWVPREGSPIGKATGFFRTVEKDGRWWLLDPEGKPFFDIGADHVNYRAHWCEALGYAPYHRNVEAKFHSEEAWGASAIQRLTEWGFSTLPAAHSPSLRYRGLPHILFASFGSSFAKREWIAEPIHWTGFPDVFSPHWPIHCRIIARKMATESRNDPWCIGTFLDNELEWYGKKDSLVDEVFKLTPNAPAKRELLRWLMKRWGSLAEINHQLRSDYADEAAFLASTTVPSASASLTEVRAGFLSEIADRYFSVATKAMREADPDHLILGCRFAGRAPEELLPSAGRYNDIFTFNTYPRVDFENLWHPDGTGGAVRDVPRQLTDMYRVMRKPMIITEWSFPALDSGLPCKHGAGMRVDTQEQKAACYRIFANAMSDLPFMVGYHYFMWADEPKQGISSTFPEDSNYGLVNEKDEPYETLVRTAAEVNRGAASRHARSITSGDLELHATKNEVEVVNVSDEIPARGRLRISADGTSRIEEVMLKAKSRQRFAIDSQGAWYAELQQWDGTKKRVIGGRALGPQEVANVSTENLDGIPVVLDGSPVIAVTLTQLKPGHTRILPTPTAAFVESQTLKLKADSVTWENERRDGSLFSNIHTGDLQMGRVVFALHQKVDGHDYWTETDRVHSLRIQEQADAWIIEAVGEYAGGTGMSGPAHFRAAMRGIVFKRGGLAQVKPLWVENTDSRSWQLSEMFWFCRSAIGGSSDDDIVGGPDVPNYYRRAQFFTDRKLGGCFGAISQSDDWHIQFWRDSSIHPDIYWKVDREMQKGQRYECDDIPYVSIYAQSDLTGWNDIARRNQQAAHAVLTGR